MMTKVCFVVKSDLSRDSRVMSEAKILVNNIPGIHLDIINLPDSDEPVKVMKKISFFRIKCLFRHKPALRLFVLLEWTVRSVHLVVKARPKVLHVHDSSSSLVGVLSKLILRDKVFLVYDDHELPGSSNACSVRLLERIEKSALMLADAVIEASPERKDYIKNRLNIDEKKVSFFLNLPYDAFQTKNDVESGDSEPIGIKKLKKIKWSGSTIILHQGSLDNNRCGSQIKDVIANTPDNFLVAILGPGERDFITFCYKHSIPKHRILFLPAVRYTELPALWRHVDLALIMYTNKNINNKLCAPNRLYLAYLTNTPYIYNGENPTLSAFCNKFGGGVEINSLDKCFSVEDCPPYIGSPYSLYDEEVQKLVSCYEQWLM